MKPAIRMTMDGLIRALKLRAHELADDQAARIAMKRGRKLKARRRQVGAERKP
ncbi:MAG: hypothetical protein R3D45_05625 [Rhizobiaceae bacterium]